MNQMRINLAQVYSAKWVASLSPEQVVAVHLRLQRKGKIKL